MKRVKLGYVLRRARSTYGKHAAAKIELAIKEGALSDILAAKIIRHESSECYDFSKHRSPLIVKKEDRKEVESRAYDLAYGLRNESASKSVILRAEERILVFVDIDIDESENAKIPIRKIIHLHLDLSSSSPNQTLTIEQVEGDPEYFRTDSRYLADWRYICLKASGLQFLESEVDRLFPYSTDHPARRARRPTFPKEEAFGFLDSHYESTNFPSKIEALSGVLYHCYTDRGKKPPGNTTSNNLAKAWLDRKNLKI